MVCRKRVAGRRVDSKWLHALQLKLRNNTTHSHGTSYKGGIYKWQWLSTYYIIIIKLYSAYK